MTGEVDVVIVGGGPAGAVLASRLSEDDSRRVLLLEAGEAYRPNLYLPDLANADVTGGPGGHDWGDTGATGLAGCSVSALRGKALGGSSAVNAAVAIRARAADFAKWRRRGIDGWTFDDVLPAFKAIENTPDGGDHFRGRTGPLPVRARRTDELTPSLNAFVDTAANLGFGRVADFNGASQAGVAPYALNVISGRRINTGIAFLGDDVRTRPNLTITPHVEVDRVLFDGDRAAGVVDAAGTPYRARQVILSAGAYGSPAILIRSGVGPAAHLRDPRHTAARRPASRRGTAGPSLLLQHLRPHARGEQHAPRGRRDLVGPIAGRRARRPRPARLRHPSVRPGAEPTGGAIVLAVALTQPASTGRVRLADRDPRSAPIIQYNLLGTPRDMRRMIEGVHIARRIGREPAFRAVAETEMLPGPAVTDDTAPRHAIIEQLDVYHHATSTVAMAVKAAASSTRSAESTAPKR